MSKRTNPDKPDPVYILIFVKNFKYPKGYYLVRRDNWQSRMIGSVMNTGTDYDDLVRLAEAYNRESELESDQYPGEDEDYFKF